MASRRAAEAALLLVATLVVSGAAAAGKTAEKEKERASVYIVTVKAPAEGVDPESYQMGILAAALGSKEKAKEALVYNYKIVLSGFAASLTPAQLEKLKKRPEFVMAQPQRGYSLHDNADKTQV